jgi:hypothetical protein
MTGYSGYYRIDPPPCAAPNSYPHFCRSFLVKQSRVSVQSCGPVRIQYLSHPSDSACCLCQRSRDGDSIPQACRFNEAQFILVKSPLHFSELHVVLTSPFDAVLVWNHLSDDADLHPYWNEGTDSLDTIADFKEQHFGTSYACLRAE